MHKKNNQIKRIDQKRRLAICITYRKIGVSPVVSLFLLVFLLYACPVNVQKDFSCQDDDDISKGYLYMDAGWGILSGQAIFEVNK